MSLLFTVTEVLSQNQSPRNYYPKPKYTAWLYISQTHSTHQRTSPWLTLLLSLPLFTTKKKKRKNMWLGKKTHNIVEKNMKTCMVFECFEKQFVLKVQWNLKSIIWRQYSKRQRSSQEFDIGTGLQGLVSKYTRGFQVPCHIKHHFLAEHTA